MSTPPGSRPTAPHPMRSRHISEVLTAVAEPFRRRLRILANSAPARGAALRRTLAATVAISLSLLAWTNNTSAASRHREWGAVRTVLVAVQDLPVGTAIGPEEVESQLWPPGLVLADAVDQLPDGTVVASADILAGEPLAGPRISARGVRTSQHSGRSTVQVELTLAVPSLVAGDHLDVLAAPPANEHLPGIPDVDGPPREATIVASDAIVTEVHGRDPDTTLTLAVLDADVAPLAAATLSGPVTVVVRPPS